MTDKLAALTREGILDTKDIGEELVHVPEWGGTVLVRGLTGTERDEFEQSCVRGRGKKAEVNLRNFRAKLVVLCARTPDGASRLFLEDDAEALGRKSAAAISRIFEPAARLSGLTDEDMEELAGNS